MHRHRCRNEKARGCEPFKCRLRIRPGLFLNGFFSIRNTVCWSFLRVHYAGYVYPAAFARLSPKVRDLVVVAGAHLLLNVNQRLHIATLWAGINRYVLSPQRKEHCPESNRRHARFHGLQSSMLLPVVRSVSWSRRRRNRTGRIITLVYGAG